MGNVLAMQGSHVQDPDFPPTEATWPALQFCLSRVVQGVWEEGGESGCLSPA